MRSWSELAQRIRGETEVDRRHVNSSFSQLAKRLLDELPVETRALAADNRVTHAVQVLARGEVERVLCGTTKPENIASRRDITFNVPTCPACVRVEALPVALPQTSTQWLSRELRRIAAAPVKESLDAQDAAARAQERATREARNARLAQRREAMQEAAQLLAVPCGQATDDQIQRARALVRLLPVPEDGSMISWYNAALRAREARRARAQQQPSARPQLVQTPRPPLASSPASVAPTAPAVRGASRPAAEAPRRPVPTAPPPGQVTPRNGVFPPYDARGGRGSSEPGRRVFPTPGALAGRGSSEPGKKVSATPGVFAGRGSSGPGTGLAASTVAAPRDELAGTPSSSSTHRVTISTGVTGSPSCSELAERILALVQSGSYMSSNKIAQALREQGDGTRTQSVFATVAAMFGDQRLTKINDVIRPGPAARKNAG